MHARNNDTGWSRHKPCKNNLPKWLGSAKMVKEAKKGNLAEIYAVFCCWVHHLSGNSRYDWLKEGANMWTAENWYQIKLGDIHVTRIVARKHVIVL